MARIAAAVALTVALAAGWLGALAGPHRLSRPTPGAASGDLVCVGVQQIDYGICVYPPF